MATVTNLYIDQGTDFNAILTITNPNGTIMDLSGFTVVSQFRKSYQSSTAVNFTASIYDAEAGKILLHLDPEDTTDIKAGRYLYDVEVTSLTNIRFRVLEGIVVITPEITRI